MSDQSRPLRGVAFALGFCLYKNDGTLIANPGTITAKISKDFGDWADIGTVTEEDSTYGQLKAALTATEMTADVVMVYVVDDTSGCVPFTATLHPAAAQVSVLTAANVNSECDTAISDAALATAAALATVDGIVDDILTDTGTTLDTLVKDLPTNAELATALAGADDAVLAAIAALPDDTDVTAVLAAIALVKVKTDTIGALSVTVTSPVAESGVVTIYQGDDYDETHGRELSFLVADSTHALGLDDVTAVVKFKCSQATWTATDVTSTADGYTVTFEPDATETALLTHQTQGYELEATLSDGDVCTLASGELTTVIDI